MRNNTRMFRGLYEKNGQNIDVHELYTGVKLLPPVMWVWCRCLWHKDIMANLMTCQLCVHQLLLKLLSLLVIYNLLVYKL